MNLVLSLLIALLCVALPRPALADLLYLYEPEALFAEPMPSGEGQHGKVWGWDPERGAMTLQHPKIMFGPGALDNLTGNVPVQFNVLTLLASAVPQDGLGMRGGLVAYVPAGRYGLWGHVSFSGHSHVRYDVVVLQGRFPDNALQPRITVGGPVVVGGGSATAVGPSWSVVQTAFSAPDIQCYVAAGDACEIVVAVVASDIFGQRTSGLAGVAMAELGPLPLGHVSKMTIMRWNGAPGQ